MARSVYVYVVKYHDTILGAFTVKREAKEAIDRMQDIPPNMSVWRYQDGYLSQGIEIGLHELEAGVHVQGPGAYATRKGQPRRRPALLSRHR